MPRPQSLDQTKRNKIIALLANGNSRRVAARVVGCAHSTITRTALRDPQFAADLNAAEQSVEIEAIRQIRRAATEGRYWRAAAWLAERKNPRDFARRDPTVLDDRQMARSFLTVLAPILHKLPDATLDRIFRHLDRLIDYFHKHPRALGLLNSPLPAPRPAPPAPDWATNSAPDPEMDDDSPSATGSASAFAPIAQTDDDPLDDAGASQPLPPHSVPSTPSTAPPPLA